MAEEDEVNWAVIPAAGLGTRMSENAVLGCKELIEIGGMTMLERTIQEVEDAGISKIIVISSPNKPAIEAELEERGVEIVYQMKPNGLVDAIRCARSMIGNSPCLVALPDVLFTDTNPSTILRNEFDGSTRLAVVQTASPWGEYLCDTGRVTELEGGRILGISEKHPDRPFPLGEFRVTGRAIWTKAFWDVAEDNEVEALRRLIENGILSASFVKTSYIDVGLTVGYEYAQSIFNR